MNKFEFVINFTLSLIKNSDLEGAKQMIDGCNSKFNIQDLGHSRKVQNMLKEINFDNNDNLVNDIKHVLKVFQAQEQGIIVI